MFVFCFFAFTYSIKFYSIFNRISQIILMFFCKSVALQIFDAIFIISHDGDKVMQFFAYV